MFEAWKEIGFAANEHCKKKCGDRTRQKDIGKRVSRAGCIEETKNHFSKIHFNLIVWAP